MTNPRAFLRISMLLAAALPAACAQPASSTMPMGRTRPMPCCDKGMNEQAMKKHCADMKQSMGQGQMSPDMQKMMAQCGDMDRGMGMSQPVPDTHSR